MSGCGLLRAGPVHFYPRSSVHTCIRKQACIHHVMELHTACIKGMSSTVGAVLNIAIVFRAVLCAGRINH